jgi:hypothetical protein
MRTLDVDLGDMRVAGAVVLGAAAARAALPFHAGIPCPLRALTGIPCPFCGMTTSVTDTVQLRWGPALAANPAGLLVVLAAIVLLAAPRLKTVAVPGWLPYAAITLMWVWELLRFQIL